jgi:hypothetical protein
LTSVVAEALLFPGIGSTSRLPLASLTRTVALLVTAKLPISTLTVTVALEPEVRPPRLQLNEPPVAEQTPWVEVSPEKVPGSKSVMVTRAASCGPLLVTTMVKVTMEPALMLAGAFMVMARSGTPGAILGMTATEGADSGLLPSALMECTVKV